jgi:TolA-binding protein
MKSHALLFIALFLVSQTPVISQETRENADFKLAVNLYNDKLFDLALEQFRQFVATYPNTQQGIEARFYLGLSQAKLGKHDDARLTFQNFALAFPENARAPEAWWNVGEQYAVMENPREAALAFERLKTFHPKSRLAPGALMKSSEYFEQAGDADNARRVLRTLIVDYASSDVVLPARLKLAQRYLVEQQFELARAEAKRVADGSKDPNLASQGLVLMARALVSLKKYEEAQLVLNNVVKEYRSAPSYYTALLFLGSLLRESGDVEQAFTSWRLVEIDSARAPVSVRQEALMEAGSTFCERYEYSKALQSYERAAALKGDEQFEARLRAGLVAEQLNDLRKSRMYLLQAREDSTAGEGLKDALIASARVEEKSGNHSEALSIISMFADRFPRDGRMPQLAFQSAKITGDQQDYTQAVSRFDALINSYPSNPIADDALFERAEALRLSGASDRALEAYEDLLKRYPSSEFIESARSASERLRRYELKNKEAGLEKLALLVGDVIAQQSRSDLALRLGEIYFYDLKDYAKAADQYAAALRLGLSSEKRATAWYHQGRSHDLAAGQVGNVSSKQDLLLKALAAFDSLLRISPAGEWSDDAVISQLGIRLRLAAGVADLRSTSTEFLQSRPVVKRRDLVQFMIGEAFRSKQGFEDAARSYAAVLRERPLKDVEEPALYRLAESLLKVGQRDSASLTLREYLRKYPAGEHAAMATWTLARAQSEKGYLRSALDLYQQIESAFSYTSFAAQLVRARADAYFAADEYANAAGQYEKLIADEDRRGSELRNIPLDVLFNLGMSYGKLRKWNEAERSFARYLIRDDSTERAGQVYYQLATIAREQNNISLAARYLQRASQFAGASADGLNQASFEAAELFFRNEEYANAIGKYEQATERSVSDSLRQYVLARIVVSYIRLNNAREADTRASAFVKSYPNQARYAAEFEYERGMYFLRKDDYVSAKRHFDNVIQKYPTTRFVPNAAYGNARIAELTNKSADAVKLYEGILLRYSGESIAPRVRLSLGNLYYAQEQWDPAARQYKAILDSESRAPDLVPFAMNNLIMAYKQLSMFDGALELTRKYIERFPDDPELMTKRVDIGVLYQRLGYYDQSVVHLQSLLEGADADLEAEVRYYIGEAYFYKGDYQQAILEFLKVPYLVTKKTKADWAATSYYMAGQAYEKMSKFEQAITMYRQIISRPGIDATFKTGAQREIDRVTALMKANK